MIDLVKNELSKIAHKKGIYIYAIILSVLYIFSSLIYINITNEESMNKSREEMIEFYEEDLESYNLNDPSVLNDYVDSLTELELLKLEDGYDYYSAEYYYIEESLYYDIFEIYTAIYIDNVNIDLDEIHDGFVVEIENYDWRRDVEEEKQSYLEELNSLNNSDMNDNEKREQLNILISGCNYRLDRNIPPSYSSASQLVDDYVYYGEQYVELDLDEVENDDYDELVVKRDIEEYYFLTKYKLDNDIIYTDDEAYEKEYEMSLFTDVDTFVIIAMVIISGGIIAEEFNKGTVKQLLLSPNSRVKILLSKIIASIIALGLFCIFYYILRLISLGIEYKNIKVLFDPVYLYNFDVRTVEKYSILKYSLINLLAILPEYIILFMLMIFVGVVTTNSTFSIIIVFGIIFGSYIFDLFLPDRILALWPTSCWNLTGYLFGGITSNKYASLGLSIAICIITFLILVISSFIVFKKKDIKNQ